MILGLKKVQKYLIKFMNKLSSTQILIFGFLFLELLGSILLYLPIANRYKISFIDAFFTATSALCVTGLTVKNTFLQFSLFGKITKRKYNKVKQWYIIRNRDRNHATAHK